MRKMETVEHSTDHSDKSKDSEKGLYIRNNETSPTSAFSIEPEPTVDDDDPVRTVHGIKVR
jgi:hypothetical protein